MNNIRMLGISIVLGLAIGVLSIAAIADQTEEFSFALWGDMPYAKNGDDIKLAALTTDINDSRVKFSIFDGDIKDGSSLCDDGQYTGAIERFNAFKAPVIYVPGDNEWTDCHRTNNGGYNNLERLAHLRAVMFNGAESFGRRTLELEHQGPLGGAYAENVRWIYGDVVFVGLNVPGSNNNKVNGDAECTKKSARSLQDCADDNAEFLARDAANIAFLKESFQNAKDAQNIGLVVTIQADPGFDLPETEDVNERTQPGFDGYNDFLTALITETRNFKGQVVLVHGDTHFFKLDKPLLDQAKLIKNFTRLETFGSPNAHWVKVTVNHRNPNVFSFEPMIIGSGE